MHFDQAVAHFDVTNLGNTVADDQRHFVIDPSGGLAAGVLDDVANQGGAYAFLLTIATPKMFMSGMSHVDSNSRLYQWDRTVTFYDPLCNDDTTITPKKANPILFVVEMDELNKKGSGS